MPKRENAENDPLETPSIVMASSFEVVRLQGRKEAARKEAAKPMHMNQKQWHFSPSFL